MYSSAAGQPPPKQLEVYIDDKLVMVDPGTTVLQVTVIL